MNYAKRLMVLTLVCFLISFAVLANGTKEAVTSDLLESIKTKGEMVVAMEGCWAPWTFHDEADKLVGFDTEVAAAVAAKLGVKASFVEGEWDGLFAGLDSKRYDTVANGVE
ncbi:MAG: transporter substrate-binding domain-containing protein, partial [Spirochaetales bacterium]|nr:transporter substrate-binding domain-containing protein [Candidatus Physcosoma equi]